MPNLRSKTWTTTTPANVEDAQYWEDHLISDEAAAKAAGAVQNAFKRIAVQSGGSTTNVDASGEDTGLVLEAGSNVTLTATGKNIRIDSTGGGGGGGSYTAGKGIIISGDEIETDLKGYTLSTETAEAFGSTADRTYAVGLDANGDLAVNIPWTDADTLDELGDVALTTPADGDILRYSSADSEWQNSDALSVAEGAIAQNVSDIDDIDDEVSAICNVYGSKNLCPIESRTISGFTFAPDKNGYMTCSSNEDTRAWGYTVANQFITLKAGTYFIKAFAKTAGTTGYYGIRLFDSANNAIFVGDWNEVLSNGQTFTLSADIDIGVVYKVGNGSYAFLIMDNRIKDRTYVPYAPTNRDCMSYAVNTMLGAHNLAPCTLTANVTSQGVTYAVDSEKILTATWSATPTGSGLCTYSLQDVLTPKLEVGKTYRLTGCPRGGSWAVGAYKYRVYIYDSTTSSDVCVDYGSGATFTVKSGKKYAIWVVVGPNAGSSGTLTFKPMITAIEDTDPTYAPHAMTNKELTEVKKITPSITSTAYTLQSAFVSQCGKMIQMQLNIKTTSALSVGNNADGTISGIPLPVADLQNLAYNGANPIGILIQPNGTFRVRAFTALASGTDITATFCYIAK